MSADMAFELKPKNVCVVSIWPGAVRTELITTMMESRKDEVRLSPFLFLFFN
ncbi:unnamed protein product [Cylicostephanus goldi]|uniref:Uncharacterized protein n=1 Tax=Cylicostephanus goldi TaxID=71465 RepID=A0A3P7NEU2_CYLGO|nr:unnamed protein product [Cylicostephanus goldi]